MSEETITIPMSTYLELVERDEFLSRLEAAGVDNWEWYHLAFQNNEDECENEDCTDVFDDMWEDRLNR